MVLSLKTTVSLVVKTLTTNGIHVLEQNGITTLHLNRTRNGVRLLVAKHPTDVILCAD